MTSFAFFACAFAAAILLVWPELRRATEMVSGEETSVAGAAGMRGEIGRVVTSQEGESWAEVRGERWKVHADAPLALEQRVRVLAVENLELRVEPATNPEAPEAKLPLLPPSRVAGLVLWAAAGGIATLALSIPALYVLLGVPLASLAILAIPGGLDL